MLDLKVEGLEELERTFTNFHQQNNKAISRAMNRVASVAQTKALRTVGGRGGMWNIKQGDLKRYVNVEKATVAKNVYVFKFHSRGVNLFEFGGVQKDKGASYKIQKKSKILPSSFIKGSGRNRFILKREGKDRYPLMPYFSITPSTMFLKAEADKTYIDTFMSEFNKRYRHELDNIFR